MAFDQTVFTLARAVLVHEYEVSVGHFVGFSRLEAAVATDGGEKHSRRRRYVFVLVVERSSGNGEL